MAFHLKQSRINCPRCGEYLYIVYKIIEGSGKESLERELCQKCHRQDYFEILRNSSKIELLKFDRKGNIVDAPGGELPQKEDEGFKELTIT